MANEKLSAVVMGGRAALGSGLDPTTPAEGAERTDEQHITLSNLEYAALAAGLSPYQSEQLVKAGAEITTPNDSVLLVTLPGFTSSQNNGNSIEIVIGHDKIFGVSIATGIQVQSVTFILVVPEGGKPVIRTLRFTRN